MLNYEFKLKQSPKIKYKINFIIYFIFLKYSFSYYLLHCRYIFNNWHRRTFLHESRKCPGSRSLFAGVAPCVQISLLIHRLLERSILQLPVLHTKEYFFCLLGEESQHLQDHRRETLISKVDLLEVLLRERHPLPIDFVVM